MWIRKSKWESQKQTEILLRKIITNFKGQVADLKSYEQKFDCHYKDLYKICKELVDNNGSMADHVRVLEMKNKALQASLDEAMRQIENLKGEN